MSREDGHLRASEPQEEESPPGRDRPVVSARPGRWSGPDREPPLEDPALFINRELSLLEFNDRVLQLARDESNPLLERLRFLTISTSNLDEFFEIRVAGVIEHLAYDVALQSADGLTPRALLAQISERTHALVEEQYRVLNEEILPELEEEGIHLLRRSHWTPEQTRWIADYFEREVLPILTPVGLDPAHPFPRIANKTLNFIVSLQGKDAFGRLSRAAVVQAPRLLPRVIALPPRPHSRDRDFVLLSSVIHANVDALFPGMVVESCSQFRVTRNSDLFVDEEEVDDLLNALKGQLDRRRFAVPARLEVAENCPKDMEEFLLHQFELGESDLYRVNGPVNLHRLGELHSLIDRPDLKYRSFLPGTPRALEEGTVFSAIRRGDILLHHPYQSFAPVIEMIRAAATDPQVLAIKQTIYRTGTDSELLEPLVEAAKAGKEVTAVIELRARFDEAANIEIATRLQEAGAKVVYGVFGYKSHAKMLLIVRREGEELRRYVHLGTGNYHPGTARAYTDFGYLSCDPDLGADVHELFQQLTGLGQATGLRTLVQSPFRLHDEMLGRIRGEIEAAEAGEPARIIARMNSLIEPQIIRELYRASRAGVEIDLIVRGPCALRPGVPGVSENIRVRSILGRFLEHSRVFGFHAGGEEVVYLSSADWMPRNFFRRVEIAFPIREPRLKRRVLEESLLLYLQDSRDAWELTSDGSYLRVGEPKVGEARSEPASSQQGLLELLQDSAGAS
jgi:polyphosphate kinase